MESGKIAVLAAGALWLAACSATYKAEPKLTYYHGQKVPDMYISIVKASPGEIEFEIRVKFAVKMYHLVLDGDEPVAQGWFSTERGGGESYTVKMRPAEGKSFESGRSYRLCIGSQSPEAVQMSSNNYLCQVDYTFVFQIKS